MTVGQDTAIAINYTGGSIIEESIPSEDLIVLLHRLDACDSIDFRSTIQPSGGLAPYQIVVSSEETDDITTLTVEVTDANGCIAIDEISASLQSTIPQVIDLSLIHI